MGWGDDFSRRVLVSVDANGYGGPDSRRRYPVQERLSRILDAAAARAGLDRRRWHRHCGGDRELAVLPASEPEHIAVDAYVRELTMGLTDHNYDLMEGARIRVRMAVHHGVAIPATNGFAGQGVAVVTRLVDCEPVRNALLAAPGASLVVVVSGQVFAETVARRHTTLSPRGFRKVQVRDGGDAWLYVPGFDVHRLDLSGGQFLSLTRPAPARASSDW